jgi:uncharacterized damage-inducible protein DinB
MTKASQSDTAFETIATLFRHNAWANMRLFDVCAGLTEAQRGSKITGTYGSIRETLQHIVTSERSYLQRITTGNPYRRPEGSPPLTMAEMQSSIRASGEGDQPRHGASRADHGDPDSDRRHAPRH